ncbi:DNA primase [Quadrisphaera sp. INWT6]|uniref:DNA primase n=1 Tax=Quadrisphaera sp. INWT6 TaxID=2596917 RepID=UPI00189229D9|nr:DNA primase [Quadrisphaera sp. INWT6]MBF5082441.1 DNA primase [Quadrisphaera sp. INWT6]
MAGKIRREDVDAVRERVRIDEVVGEQVVLKSAGVGSLKGLCPFHDERSPSFTVRLSTGRYKCFGCDESGDVFDFLVKTTAVTFVEAVEMMAAKVGVTLRYEDGGGSRPAQDVGKRQRLLDAHRVAAEFYAERLFSPEAEVGRRFLKERGFDRAAAETFGVGYAPTGWGALTDHLRSRGFTSDELVTGGLAAQGQRGPYDRFRGRLVWPIRDVVGSVIGFGARRLTEDDSGPKYLNTPETPLYRKSHVLYGLDLAKKEIGRRKQVVVVEGYTDVMACHLAGVPTAVATCGTAFGSDHVGVVRRLLGDDDGAGQVVFTFDGDAAGQKAALRAFEHDQEFVAATYVAVEPRGMDPCDLRLADGDEAVVALVEAKRPMFEFAVRQVLAAWDLETAEGRVRALGAAAPVVAGIKDRQLREEHTRQLARMLGMDLGAVQRAVQTEALRAGRGAGAAGQGAGQGPGRSAGRGGSAGPQGRGRGGPGGPGGGGERDVVAAAERQLLALVVQAPASVPLAFDELPPDAFVLAPSHAVHEAVRKAGGVAAGREAGVSWVDHLVDASTEETADQVASLLGALAVVPLPVDSDAGLSRLASGLLHDVLLRELGRRETDLKGRAQRLEAAGEHAAAGEAYAALFALASERQRLRASTQE